MLQLNIKKKLKKKDKGNDNWEKYVHDIFTMQRSHAEKKKHKKKTNYKKTENMKRES